MSEPHVKVGILSAEKVSFTLTGIYSTQVEAPAALISIEISPYF